MKIKGLCLGLFFQFYTMVSAQQMVIYDDYPKGQDYYKGGTKAFYKELRQVLLDRKVSPCECVSESYTIPLLVKADGTVQYVKDDDEEGIAKNKCAYDMLRAALPYLENWQPAIHENKKLNAIKKIEFYPDDLFNHYSDAYFGPWSNITLPEYPGGIDKFRSDFVHVFDTRAVRENVFTYRIEIMFDVNKEGKIENTQILSVDEDPGLMKAALKAISKLNKTWKPAIRSGKAIKYRFRLPISFTNYPQKNMTEIQREEDLRFNDSRRSGF